MSRRAPKHRLTFIPGRRERDKREAASGNSRHPARWLGQIRTSVAPAIVPATIASAHTRRA